ncbi:MAG: hypothetical protein M1274_11140 [Actinobacteria bacterium]|nr:hypothetical protein [Actinomycetota bacterium]
MTPPGADPAVAAEPHVHICLHENDWEEFRDFRSVSEKQMEHDHNFRVEIIGEIKGLRADVTSAMAKMGEYLGMGKLIKFGVAVFSGYGGSGRWLLGAGHALGWW